MMMKVAVIVATVACAIPSVFSLIPGGTIGSGFSFPFFTLGGTTTTGTAAAGAITGLSVGTATLAGFGGILGVIGAGAALGGLAAAATRRGKRAAVDQFTIGEEFLFNAIAAMDEKDCGKRYVCELAATPIEALSQEELTSLLLFQTAPAIQNSGKAVFDEAVRIGAFSRSHQACQVRRSEEHTSELQSP